MFSIRNFLALVLSLGLAGPLAAQDAQLEVHAIGVYEGNVRTGNTIHGPEVKIEVRRPGETLTLVLGSYEPVRFLLDVDRNTSVVNIFVHGHGMNQSEVYVNGAQVRPRYIGDLGASYKIEGIRMRALVDRLTAETGADRLASFNGSYSAPAEPFVIDAVVEAPQLKMDYLADLVAPDLVPDALREFVGGDRDAPRADFTNEGFTLTESGETRTFPVSLDVPNISWPVAAGYDAEGQRLFGVSLGGEGFIYIYDIAADQWSVATSMDQKDAMGMVWDGARDRLILSVGLHRNGSLMEWTEADGLREMVIGVRVNDLPGYLDMFDPGNGPLAPLVPIAIEGDKLLLRTSPGRFARPQETGGASRTYMIDVMTGEAALVAYSD